MTVDDFPRFYRAIHGFDPFPWQVRLFQQVADRGWPDVLALPTASGKTSALDIAVFMLALQAGKPLQERTAPLRIFFVVDRRLVVDQAAWHAHALRETLEDPDRSAGAGSEGIAVVREVANELKKFGARPLHVVALRGGMYRDDSWTQTPTQPTVCVSTVDQVGSRLLFRGYGVSDSGKPIHAALVGNDALYLLDEAHLSQPFLETLRAVESFRGGPWARQPVGGPFRVVEISATPQSEGERFGLAGEDSANDELRRRLDAPKPAVLLEPARFEAEAAQVAVKSMTGDVRVVGIVVNRVTAESLT